MREPGDNVYKPLHDLGAMLDRILPQRASLVQILAWIVTRNPAFVALFKPDEREDEDGLSKPKLLLKLKLVESSTGKVAQTDDELLAAYNDRDTDDKLDAALTEIVNAARENRIAVYGFFFKDTRLDQRRRRIPADAFVSANVVFERGGGTYIETGRALPEYLAYREKRWTSIQIDRDGVLDVWKKGDAWTKKPEPATPPHKSGVAPPVKADLSLHNFEVWLSGYIKDKDAAGKQPAREEIQRDALAAGLKVKRDAVRDLRKKLAPHWSVPGPKPKAARPAKSSGS